MKFRLNGGPALFVLSQTCGNVRIAVTSGNGTFFLSVAG